MGPAEGLPERSVNSRDDLVTLPTAVLDERPVGMLGPQKLVELDVSLRYALDIQHWRRPRERSRPVRYASVEASTSSVLSNSQ